MFGIGRKYRKTEDYDRENWRPALKCSICNGEQVAGFENIHTGIFKEQMLIRNNAELEDFKRRYGIEEIKKIY
ncbi:MAG TPA: aspartate dehydrogenase [Lachnospiraceae bacterium]|nr:aspartate dehydrogenase [Lachnospiraceae bacterium]